MSTDQREIVKTLTTMATELADTLRFVDEWMKGAPTGRPVTADDLKAARAAIRATKSGADALGPI